MKRFTTFTVAILNVVSTGLITKSCVTGNLPIPAFTSSWTLPVGVASSDIAKLFLLATAAS